MYSYGYPPGLSRDANGGVLEPVLRRQPPSSFQPSNRKGFDIFFGARKRGRAIFPRNDYHSTARPPYTPKLHLGLHHDLGISPLVCIGLQHVFRGPDSDDYRPERGSVTPPS